MEVLQKVNPHINSVRTYQPGRFIEEVGRKLGLDPKGVLKLASNECALGVSPLAYQEIIQNAVKSYLYPDADAFELKLALAKHLNFPKEQFIIGAGSNEILVFLSQCFMGEGKSVVASEKSFIIYKILTQMMGSEFREAKMDNLTHNLDNLLEQIDDTTSIVFVCNPNNPTGTMVKQQEVRRFMEQVPNDVLVVFDEAYAEICLEQMPDTFEYIKRERAVIVLRTFSKSYGLAGLRIGYGIAPKAIVETLEKVRQPFNTTLIGQRAGVKALEDKDFIQKSRQLYSQSKKFIEQEFSKLGIQYIPTVVNFSLFKVDNTQKICQELTARGVIVRELVVYNLENYLRVTFGTMPQNERFIQTLKELI